MTLELLQNQDLLNALNKIKELKELGFDVSSMMKEIEDKFGLKMANEAHSSEEEVKGRLARISPLEIYKDTTDEEFIQMFHTYDIEKKKHRLSTANQHTQHITTFLNWYRENGVQTSFVNVSYKEAGDFILYLKTANSPKGKPYAPDTINSYHKSLSAFYNFLNDELDVLNPHIPLKEKRNHFANIAYISKKHLNVRTEVLSSDEMKELLRTIKETTSRRTPYIIARNHLLFRLMMTTGLRVSEICKLQFEDVNFKEGSVFVKEGKGKDGGKDRVTLFSQTLEEEYLAYLELRQAIETDLQNVFVTEPRMLKGELTKAKPLTGDDLNEYIEKYMRYSNNRSEGRTVTNHTLRHSFVTMMILELGVPDVEVAGYCGHSAVETTRRVYTHNRMDEKTKQRNKERMEKIGL